MRLFHLVPLLLGACSAGATPPASHAAHATDESCRAPESGFEASPGGVPEVSTEWVASHGCAVRVVDVREPGELAGGVVPRSEAIPLAFLAERASAWDPETPLVFVCRSGRRSARAVELVERMGFTRAASMTGGMLLWQAEGRATAAAPPEIRPATTPAVRWPPRADLDAETLRAVLEGVRVREVRAAALLLQGTTACVDGRERSAVLGTPGGDAGELLLALSTMEALSHEELSDAQVQTVFDHYVSSFGRFYIHTDRHALEVLAESLAVSRERIEAVVRHPPAAMRERLLEALVEPDHIGCGHLALVRRHPDEYDVRRGLTESFLRVVFTTLWRTPERVDYVVLDGGHAEEAILDVHVEGEVQPFTNVPAIAPRLGEHSFFVNHPEVAAFVRAQHARFLLSEVPLVSDVDAFEAALAERAGDQLDATLRHLAPELPVFEVRFGDELSVRRVR